MNEIICSNLHTRGINIQDEQTLRISMLEKRVADLSEKLDEAHRLSVMSQSVITHYIEAHWLPMAIIFGQLGKSAPCAFFGSDQHCDISDVTAFSEGASQSPTPPSLPSLESVSSSSIDSVYHTPSLQGAISSSLAPFETGLVPISEGEQASSTAMLPSFPGDSRSFGPFDQAGFPEVVVGEVPRDGDERWCGTCSGSHALDLVGEGH